MSNSLPSLRGDCLNVIVASSVSMDSSLVPYTTPKRLIIYKLICNNSCFLLVHTELLVDTIVSSLPPSQGVIFA